MTSYGKSNRERHTKIDQATIFPPEWRGHQTSKIVVASLILFPQGRRLSLSLHICQCMACQQCQSPLRCTVSSNTRATIGISLQSVYLRRIFGISSAYSCHAISYLLQLTVISPPAVSPPLALLSIASIFGTIYRRRIRLAFTKEQYNVRRGGTIRLAFLFCVGRQVTSCGLSCATSAISPSTRLRRCMAACCHTPFSRKIHFAHTYSYHLSFTSFLDTFSQPYHCSGLLLRIS